MNHVMKHSPATTPQLKAPSAGPQIRAAAAAPQLAATAGAPTRFGTAMRARRALVHVVTERHHYHGTVYVPDGKRRVSDVLCDGKPFLNLTDVATDGGGVDEFLAVNKSAIVSLRIVREEQATSVSIRAF